MKYLNEMTFIKHVIVCIFIALWCVQCASVLPEGSPCRDGKKNGTCVNLYKCNIAAMIYLFRKAGQTNVPEMPPTCSYRPDGEPIVCCTDCTLDNTESLRNNAVMPEGTFYPKTGPKSWLKCMEFYETLPFPCRESSATLVPFWDEEKQCQVPQFWIPSPGIGGEAAGKDQGPITYAGLGVLNLSDLSNYWKIYKIISIIRHPGYKPPSKYHDIALIKTENEINFGRSILPACLHVPGNYSLEYAQAPGWGRLGHKAEVAETLQAMYLQRYNETECSSKFPQHRHLKNGYDQNTQMCYGRHDQIVDTCEGDSGGPLHSIRWHCIYLVFGVTSFGKECGILGYPGMYTRISYCLPWIESVVWPSD